MSFIFIFPALVSLFFVASGRVEKALLSVYIPCLLFSPADYTFQLPHLPPISAAQGALIPIGCVAFVRWLMHGTRKRMDLWVIAYMVSLSISEVRGDPSLTTGLFSAFSSIVQMSLTYFTGRMLIEPKLRIPVVQRIVCLVLLLLPAALFEYRLGLNLWGLTSKLLGITAGGWFVQIRNGAARISVSFSDAELAGIAFAMVWALNAWLLWIIATDRRLNRTSRLNPLLVKLERFQIPTLILLLMLFLTRSRGPLLAAGAGFLVLLIPKFKNQRLAVALVALLLVGGASAVYQHFSQITQDNPADPSTEEQGSVVYRFQLLQAYKPIVDQGGWFGWGEEGHPSVKSQESVDNEYLLVELGYGRLGFILLLLIVAESLGHLTVCIWRFKDRESLTLAVSLLAALTILWFAITTVFLGEQLPEIGFLLIGWSQSLRDLRPADEKSPPKAGLEEAHMTRVFA